MRYFGKVGFGKDVEDPPDSGKWRKLLTERSYSGEVIASTVRTGPGDVVGAEISLDHRIAIVADPFAIENPNTIVYVGWDGALWTVTSVEIRRPRLILSLGGVYHGPTP
jgi:hypothetical protein